jgi:hypothetical protein
MLSLGVQQRPVTIGHELVSPRRLGSFHPPRDEGRVLRASVNRKGTSGGPPGSRRQRTRQSLLVTGTAGTRKGLNVRYDHDRSNMTTENAVSVATPAASNVKMCRMFGEFVL